MNHLIEATKRVLGSPARDGQQRVSHRLRPRRSRGTFRPISDPLVARWLAP